jgi:hypothetical protein
VVKELPLGLNHLECLLKILCQVLMKLVGINVVFVKVLKKARILNLLLLITPVAEKMMGISGGSRNFEKGGGSPERGWGPSPEIAKISRIMGLKS